MEWDTTVPAPMSESLTSSPRFVAGLLRRHHLPRVQHEEHDDGGALQKLSVRQALQYCVNKRHIVQVTGGPAINVASQPDPPAAMIIGYKQINPYASAERHGQPRQVQVDAGRRRLPARADADARLREQPADAGPGGRAAVGLRQGGVTLKLERAAEPGGVLQLPRDPVEPGRSGTSRSVPGSRTGTGNGAQTYFSPAARRPPLRRGFDRLRRLQRPDRRPVHRHRRADAESLSQAAVTGQKLDNYVMSQGPGVGPAPLPGAAPVHRAPTSREPRTTAFMGYVDPTNLWKK